jgi:hypothetical protein
VRAFSNACPNLFSCFPEEILNSQNPSTDLSKLAGDFESKFSLKPICKTEIDNLCQFSPTMYVMIFRVWCQFGI